MIHETQSQPDVSKTALFDPRFFDYIAERTSGDDSFLLDLKHAAGVAQIPDIWISPAQASFMQILLKLHRAEHVVEIGTLAGYSAIWMARGLPQQGRVTTIELDESYAEFAESWIAKSDVADKITLLRGNAIDVLASLEDQSADACFIDADKTGYPSYLNHMQRILKPGSLVMADNAFAFGEILADNPTDPDTPAIRGFNEYIAKQTWLQSTIVAVGDGLWVGVTAN